MRNAKLKVRENKDGTLIVVIPKDVSHTMNLEVGDSVMLVNEFKVREETVQAKAFRIANKRHITAINQHKAQ